MVHAATTLELRPRLARLTFRRPSGYGIVFVPYLGKLDGQERVAWESGRSRLGGGGGSEHFESLLISGGKGGSVPLRKERPQSIDDLETLPDSLMWALNRTAALRYGENPHQQAALYSTGARGGIARAEVLGGKEMSFN